MNRIYNANTIGFEADIEQIAKSAISLPSPAMHELSLDSTLIRLPGVVTAGKVNVPIVTNIQSVQSNPTSFENHNDAVANGQTTMTHLSAQFGFSSPEQGKGLEIQMLLVSHLVEMAKNIVTVRNGVITEANYASAVVTASSSAYSLANNETLHAAVAARTVLALSSAYHAKVKSTWMPAGEENKLRELSHLTGIGTNITGYSARPEAIAILYGYPSSGPAKEVQTSFIKLPIGIEVQFSRWWTRGGRSWSASLDICIAAEVGQASALRILKSA